ncbi:hypothetical protein F5B22DRAFT_658946 [Xylaria bambusicola]|uniref:uncharacterized protein n=1 Tax=Xylaria bambusicola TaxID=326684 RepID=UPI0020082788|nr:uncharacterized protein F5B22DRAFT_658946 [Xylaria bambusicola]KAI0508634.1 hypothetical protein F5B22DRAFT_658946 [Xylaria bambusicola]
MSASKSQNGQHARHVPTRSSSWSVGFDDENQSELARNRSNASTPAIDLDKPLPPIPRVEQRTVGNNEEPGQHYDMSSTDHRDFAYTQGGSAQAPNISAAQLKPAKNLRRPRRYAIVGPETLFQGAPISSTPSKGSNKSNNADRAEQHIAAISTTPSKVKSEDNSGSGDEVEHRHPAVLRPGQAARSTTARDQSTKPMSEHSSRSGSGPQKASYAQSSRCDQDATRPATKYSAYRPDRSGMDQRSQGHVVRSSVSLHGAPSAHYKDADEDDDDARSAYSSATYSCTPRRTDYSSSAEQDSLSIPSNDVSSSRDVTYVDGVPFEMVSAPVTPIPSPTPVPTPMAPSPAPSRGRGQHVSSRSSRTQSRSPSPAYGALTPHRPRQTQPSFLERAQERLENSVNKRLVKAGLRTPPSFSVLKVEKSPSSASLIPQEQENATSSPSLAETSWRARIERLQKRSEQPPILPPLPKKQRRRDSWEISSESETELMSRNAVPADAVRKRLNLRINIDVGDGAIADVAQSQERSKHFIPRKPVGDADSNTSTEYSDDSLFLGRGSTKRRENSSFFASEYARKRAASMARGQTTELSQEENGESKKAQSSAPLSREQLQFAALPSPVEDLHKPFPFDDRRDLPSQTLQHTSAKKGGMQLRKPTD